MDTNNDFDKLIGSIKRREPTLHNPTELTENILARIEKKSKAKYFSVLFWYRACSNIAALLLISLFLYQQTDTFESNPENKAKTISQIKIDPQLLQNKNNESANTFKTYTNYLAQNNLNNKRLQALYKHLDN